MLSKLSKAVSLLGILIILGIPLVYQWSIVDVIKLRTFDALVPEYQESGNFVILNITEEDVEREGGYPLPRERLAEIQITLLQKGAIGVAWGISFPQPDRLGGDEYFAQSLGYAPSVLAMFADKSGTFPKTTGTIIKGPEKGGIVLEGVKENLNTLGNNTLQGLAIAPTESDQLVRRIPLLASAPDGWIPSFATQIYKSLFDVKSYIITTNDNGIQEISIRGIPPVKTDSLGRKWISWVKTSETNLQDMEVAGRYVIVGVTASGVMPQIATPVGLLEPHKIQAALAESILIQDSPYIPDWSLAVELGIFVLSVALIWILTSYFGITGVLVSAISIMSLTAFGGFKLISSGLLVDVTWSLISQFITGAIGFYLRFREQYKLRQQIKKQFEHYLDPRQIKQLQDKPELLKLGGERRRCTYIFTDLRGFTALSEKIGPDKVTYIMNRVLSAQVKAIQKHGGMTDKFIGDAGMFIMGAPLDMEGHEIKAYEAAVDLIDNVKKVSEELEAEGLPPVAIGVGINTGTAIVGNMGSETRFDYSAIGDPVNVAARLESATKERGVDILIGEETEKYCGYHLKELEPIMVKGKSEPLKIFTFK
tara:strand:- start:9499 stop:11280 length:1782 start_codon:yes stop_codon:yes gene_type:complete